MTTTKFNRNEDQSGINEHMMSIINKGIVSTRVRGDEVLPILSREAVEGMFSNMTKHRVRPRNFGCSGEVHVWVKSNKGEIFFKDFSGFVERNELIDAMTYMKCFESYRDPSIQLIQWEDHFYMLVNSANMIGGYRCLLEKEDVLRVFDIK